MVKGFIKKLTNKGAAIKFQMERGMSNTEFSKTFGIAESTVRYYRKRPDVLETKRAYKLPKKYIEKIYEMASNKTTREMPGGFISIKINQKLKKDNVVDKNRKILSITKSHINETLREKFGKPLKIRKVCYLKEESKKKT